MKEVEVLVNGLVGPSYEKGHIGFRYNQKPVPYALGNHYGSVYHINLEIIESFIDSHLGNFRPLDKNNLNQWGHETEIELCRLMMEGKLNLIRKDESGEDVLVHFIWEGPMWDPKIRKTKKNSSKKGGRNMINQVEYGAKDYQGNLFEKNIILYGPPGTGKTYNTVTYAVAIIEKKPVEVVQEEINNNGYEGVLSRYHAYKKNGQIEFTTFHQSYGYEEFIEGIKPKMDGEKQGEEELVYEIKDGIFKQFCEKAQTPRIQHQNDFGIRENPTIWKVSLGDASEKHIKRDCFEKGRIRIGWDKYGEQINEETDFSQFGGKTILTYFIEEMMVGDIVLVLHDKKTIDGIGVITGDYEWLEDVSEYKRSRAVKWLAKDIHESIYELNGNKVMTLGSVYRLDRIKLRDVLQILKKYPEQTSTKAIEENTENYVFIIDEINRGNISQILGELITLIEPTKRIGQAEEIKLRLPYSLAEFGVPNNVYILGTMNTADRSIARLDIALRRRFHFIEMMPRPDFLEGINIHGIDVAAMLTKMNQRIEVLYDREHTIGHAYFTDLIKNQSLEKLGTIFKNTILPLLQEYFYEDYQLIRMVLGDPNKEPEEQFIQENKIDYRALFGNVNENDSIADHTFTINEKAFTNVESYRKIYLL